jgi:hypothetical protein
MPGTRGIGEVLSCRGTECDPLTCDGEVAIGAKSRSANGPSAPWSRLREAGLPRAARVQRMRLHPGLRRTCLSGPPEQKPQGRNQAGREACGRTAWAWMLVLVDCSGRRGGYGPRVAGSAFRMGGKWLWGLGLRRFSESCGWRLRRGLRGGLRSKSARRGIRIVPADFSGTGRDVSCYSGPSLRRANTAIPGVAT